MASNNDGTEVFQEASRRLTRSFGVWTNLSQPSNAAAYDGTSPPPRQSRRVENVDLLPAERLHPCVRIQDPAVTLGLRGAIAWREVGRAPEIAARFTEADPPFLAVDEDDMLRTHLAGISFAGTAEQRAAHIARICTELRRLFALYKGRNVAGVFMKGVMLADLWGTLYVQRHNLSLTPIPTRFPLPFLRVTSVWFLEALRVNGIHPDLFEALRLHAWVRQVWYRLTRRQRAHEQLQPGQLLLRPNREDARVVVEPAVSRLADQQPAFPQ